MRFTVIVFLSIFIIACGGKSSRTNNAPKAIANVNKSSFTEGETILLDGSDSSDPDGDKLTYQWEYNFAGVQYTLNGEKPEFEAPEVDTNGATLEITLTVKDTYQNSATINNLSIQIGNFFVSPEIYSLADKCNIPWYLNISEVTVKGSDIFKQTSLKCSPHETLLTTQDFETLTKLPNLELISLIHNNRFTHPQDPLRLPIESFPDLSSLTKLRILSLQRIDFQSLESLVTIPALRDLTIADSDLRTNLPNFKDLNQLERLRLYNVSPPEALDFTNFLHLKKLIIEHTGVPQPLPAVTTLINLPEALEDLVLQGREDQTDFNTTPDLSNLINLKTLTINNHSENIASDLSGSQQLKSLDLKLNKITVLPELTQLNKLETLNVSENNLSTLSDLSTLENLKTLNVSYNKLTLLDLPHLKNLEYLSVSNNELSMLLISDSPKLKDLYTSRNQLSSFQELSNLPNLFRLDVSDNQITEIPDLLDLENLRFLVATENNLSRYPQIPPRTNGKSLTASFSYDKVMDITPLQSLSSPPTNTIILIMECIDTELDFILSVSSEFLFEINDPIGLVTSLPDRIWWGGDEDDRIECR